MKEPSQAINIGRGQRTWRFFVGVVSTCFSIGLAVFLVVSGANRCRRLV